MAPKYDFQVLLTIARTPPWANGGQTPNHPPTNLNDLTQFAQMLATRYNGTKAGIGVVTRFSVWNEPNLQLFLAPQFQGNEDRQPRGLRQALHGRLQGDQGRQPDRARRRRRDLEPRAQPSDAPARRLGRARRRSRSWSPQVDPKLPFAAWATHPYPSTTRSGRRRRSPTRTSASRR